MPKVLLSHDCALKTRGMSWKQEVLQKSTGFLGFDDKVQNSLQT